MRSSCGFTLAELLLALVILGLIATFTIPKVLTAQQSTQWKSMGKETVGMFSGALDAYRQANGGLQSTTVFTDLTPYMNYVRRQTSANIDDAQGDPDLNCNAASRVCLVLHNGGVLSGTNTEAFGGTTTTNAIKAHFDPDGKVTDGGTGDTSPTAVGKAIPFFIYYNGRVTDRGKLNNPTQTSTTGYTPNPSKVPPWWSWD